MYVVERVLHSNRMSLFWRQIVAGEEYYEITSLKKQGLTCEMDVNDYERFQFWNFANILLNLQVEYN
jgi:hypothetical protein